MSRLAKIGAWELDVATMKQEWTDETYTIHDRERGIYDPNSTEELSRFEPGSKELIGKAFEEAIGQGKPYDLEVEMATVKGNRKWVRAVCLPLLKDGKVTKLRGTVQDITERKKAEQQILTLNSRLQLLISAVQELASAKDMETVMAAVRSYTRKLTGSDGSTFVLREDDHCYYADEEAIGPLWKGQRFPLSACISGWVMLNKQPAAIEDIYSDPRIPIEAYRPTFVKSLAIVPIRTPDPLGAIGNYWARQHKPTEEELQLMQTLADAAARAVENVRLLEELEQRVRARTAQLEDANKELEAFSYSVSHDLRAPLRAMSGFSNILTEEYQAQMPPEASRYLGLIAQNAGQMGALVDDLLRFARLNRQPLDQQSVSTDKLVRQALEELHAEQEGRQVEINIGELPECQADPALLKQVWVNLLSNALKFTRRRQVAKIEVGAISDFGSQGADFLPEAVKSEISNLKSVIYYVRDNGVGFDMQYAHKLFGVFQRLHRAEDYEGTGVGLAIVQRVVHRHGGRAWAEAAVDKGATFYFTLGGFADD
jgi:signal transduction histidine kinase